MLNKNMLLTQEHSKTSFSFPINYQAEVCGGRPRIILSSMMKSYAGSVRDCVALSNILGPHGNRKEKTLSILTLSSWGICNCWARRLFFLLPCLEDTHAMSGIRADWVHHSVQPWQLVSFPGALIWASSTSPRPTAIWPARILTPWPSKNELLVCFFSWQYSTSCRSGCCIGAEWIPSVHSVAEILQSF